MDAEEYRKKLELDILKIIEEKLGFRVYPDLIRDPEKMSQIAKLFGAPHLKEALEVFSKISTWDYDWFRPAFTRWIAGRDQPEVGMTQIDLLIQAANSPDTRTYFQDMSIRF